MDPIDELTNQILHAEAPMAIEELRIYLRKIVWSHHLRDPARAMNMTETDLAKALEIDVTADNPPLRNIPSGYVDLLKKLSGPHGLTILKTFQARKNNVKK